MIAEKPTMLCKLADDTSACIFNECPTFKVCFPKPCDHCEVNIKQAIDDGEVTCYHTCWEWTEWSKLSLPERGNK